MTSPLSQSVKFVPFESVLDGGFWHQLGRNKLDVYRLNEAPVPLRGYYENGYADGLPCRVTVDFTAFELNYPISKRCFPLEGSIINTNTLDKFKTVDKQKMINDSGKSIIDAITSQQYLDKPNALVQMLLLSFADLKKHMYYYWFAFPAVNMKNPPLLVKPAAKMEDVFSEELIACFLHEYDQFRAKDSSSFFSAKIGSSQIALGSLREFNESYADSYLCFCDPATNLEHPGWPLRNLLAAAASRLSIEATVRVICFRDRIKDGKRICGHSLVLEVRLSPICDWENVDFVGWEKNTKGRLLPRMNNLSSTMDPAKLAESAVDLNLKLMRWRIMPDLELDLVSKTRCLLLGSGTLGCNVARLLMAWGVRQITLVDNGRVSYSNPVRQTLFQFSDSVDGGRLKAEAAVDAMKAIYPGIEAVSVNLSVPMPGHAVTSIEFDKVKEDYLRLEELIKEHDVIYLLLDTREARWLPTLLAAVHQKLVINAALGFDSYLVMRHGYASQGLSPSTYALSQASPTPDSSDLHSRAVTKPSGNQLGCYFCNDVVGPSNSTRDRTLDQQCTVTRPGVSMIAASYAVELMVSIIQHPDGACAAADTCDEYMNARSPLGLIPHQIRGFLSRFNEVIPSTRAFTQCTACSQIVMDSYRQDGFEFLLRAFNDPDFLEDLTGLKKLQEDTCIDDVIALSDDDLSM